MSDDFKSYSASLRDPISSAQDVTPNDTSDLSKTTRAIYVGAPGDLRLTLVGGETVTFQSAGNGWHPVRATRIWATGTTATSIMACC